MALPGIMGALGAAGGGLKQRAANQQSDKIMAGIGDRRFGIDRVYGAEQDALIRALSQGRADQSMAQSSVARTDLGRQLQSAANSGGTEGTRAAMFSGGEAELAGRVGQGVAQEGTGNVSAAASTNAAAAQDLARRNQLRLEALKMYRAAQDARGSVGMAMVKGAANGLMGAQAGGV